MFNNYDILGLYETKLDDLDTVNSPGYNTFVNNRTGNCRIRSGGVLVAVRDNIFNLVIELKCSYENGIWLKLDKEFTRGENSVYYHFYIYPQVVLDIQMKNISMLLRLISLNSVIMMMRDFNACTRTLPDFVQFDKDDIHTMHFDNVVQKYLLDVENLKPAIQLDRVAQDTGRPTNYGYKLLSLSNNNNLYIANGRSGRLGSWKTYM